MTTTRLQPEIPGYDYGRPSIAKSPLTIDELRQIEQTIGWNDQDQKILRRHENIFVHHAEKMVDSWREVIGSQPHLVKWFFGLDGKRDSEYAAKVKPRFVQWVIDVAVRPQMKHGSIIKKRLDCATHRQRRTTRISERPLRLSHCDSCWLLFRS